MPVEQINIEYFFRLLYQLFFRGAGGAFDLTHIKALAAQVWFWVVVVGYGISIIAFFVIVYATVRLFELRKREAEYYSTLLVTPETEAAGNPRWKHIQSLLNQNSQSAWREAITEADIMLDDVLTRRGYVGDGVGEKLRGVNPADLASLQDAWEAHKVRNQIAHEGSAFLLSESLAQRTLARYGAVFHEWGAV